ncbi:subclass B3 metallo-beta-lactamase [Asticcacaulis solisilvae]|nr:subclass B3 metallo-beta-lactamase [Asticcacaulis solisilvae]
MTLPGVAMPGAALAHNPEWDAPSEPFRIAGNVYSVGTEGIGVYLITSPAGHILLDGATQKGAAVVEANIKALGFKLRDVKYIIETHAHFDHVGGIAKLKADTGAAFVASAADRKALESGAHDGDNENGVGHFPAIKVDRVIGDGERLVLDGIYLKAHLTPGHTKGCTSWTTDVQEKGVTYSVLFYCSASVAGNALVGNKAHPDIVADYRKSFATFKSLKPDIPLTNHPSQVAMAEKRKAQKAGKANAFVDREALPKLVAEQEKAFEAELKRQQAHK